MSKKKQSFWSKNRKPFRAALSEYLEELPEAQRKNRELAQKDRALDIQENNAAQRVLGASMTAKSKADAALAEQTETQSKEQRLRESLGGLFSEMTKAVKDQSASRNVRDKFKGVFGDVKRFTDEQIKDYAYQINSAFNNSGLGITPPTIPAMIAQLNSAVKGGSLDYYFDSLYSLIPNEAQDSEGKGEDGQAIGTTTTPNENSAEDALKLNPTAGQNDMEMVSNEYQTDTSSNPISASEKKPESTPFSTNNLENRFDDASQKITDLKGKEKLTPEGSSWMDRWKAAGKVVEAHDEFGEASDAVQRSKAGVGDSFKALSRGVLKEIKEFTDLAGLVGLVDQKKLNKWFKTAEDFLATENPDMFDKFLEETAYWMPKPLGSLSKAAKLKKFPILTNILKGAGRGFTIGQATNEDNKSVGDRFTSGSAGAALGAVIPAVVGGSKKIFVDPKLRNVIGKTFKGTETPSERNAASRLFGEYKIKPGPTGEMSGQFPRFDYAKKTPDPSSGKAISAAAEESDRLYGKAKVLGKRRSASRSLGKSGAEEYLKKRNKIKALKRGSDATSSSVQDLTERLEGETAGLLRGLSSKETKAIQKADKNYAKTGYLAKNLNYSIKGKSTAGQVFEKLFSGDIVDIQKNIKGLEQFGSIENMAEALKIKGFKKLTDVIQKAYKKNPLTKEAVDELYTNGDKMAKEVLMLATHSDFFNKMENVTQKTPVPLGFLNIFSSIPYKLAQMYSSVSGKLISSKKLNRMVSFVEKRMNEGFNSTQGFNMFLQQEQKGLTQLALEKSIQKGTASLVNDEN